MAITYIAAGSNLGEREKVLREALAYLAGKPELSVLRTSPYYETRPQGFAAQECFLNAVWEIETFLPPLLFFRILKETETFFGRRRILKNGPRSLDLDLLAFDRYIIRTRELTVPHPRMQERWFVLKPFSDVAPDWRHPVLGESVRELLNKVSGEKI